MEKFLRRWLEKIGAGADELVGKDSSALSPESLMSALFQAVESHLAEDQQGVRRIAPAQMTVALSYEVYSQVEEDVIEAVRQELTDAVVSYIHDHRYALQPGLTLTMTCDPFLRQPFDVRVDPRPPSASGKHWWLVAKDGRRIALNFGEPQTPQRLTVGRRKDNDIMVDDPTVSRFHASLTLNHRGEIIVSDLGSANGTFVNGQRITSAQVLHAHDELTLGSVPFKLEDR
jgi:hypothetical protein